MDPTNRTLDSMITIPHPSQIGDFIESQRDETQVERPVKRRAIDNDAEMEMEEETDNTSAWTKGSGAIPESECDFTSIQELRREVGKGNQGKWIVIFLADLRCGRYHAQTCFRRDS
jgi:DNA mismatch repair protein MLH1